MTKNPFRSWFQPFGQIRSLTWEIMAEADTRPSEWFLAVTIIWMGLWFVVPLPRAVIIHEYLAQFMPLSLWTTAFVMFGVLHLRSIAKCYMFDELRHIPYRCAECKYFALVHIVGWLMLVVLFAARGFFLMATVICPIYFLAAAWVFIRHALREPVNG